LVALTAAQTIAAAPASALAPGGAALVHAGAGGVGHVAVQLLARVHGLTVTATASPANHAFVKACGAAAVLDYNSPSHAADVAAAGPFAVVFDLVGADAARAAFPHVAPGGAFLHVFNTGTDDALLAEGRAAAEAGGWTFVGPTLVQQDGATLKQVAAWIDGGSLAVDVACVLPLAQAGDAHARLEGLHVRGKIVLRVGGDE
jgi:NADPH2:quinone reductase